MNDNQTVKVNYSTPTKQIDDNSSATYAFARGLDEQLAHEIMQEIIQILSNKALTTRQAQTVLTACNDYILDHTFN